MKEENLTVLFGTAILLAYVGCCVVCWLKGKRTMALVCFVLFLVFALMPAVSLWAVVPPIVGAIRIAKPDSFWARRFYDAQKMEIARKRFSETAIKGGRKRAWITVAAIGLIALCVVTVLLLIAGYPRLHVPLPSAASPSSAASPLATATVQRVAHGKIRRYSINVPDGWSVEQEQKYDYDLMMSAQNQTLCVGVIAEEPNLGSIETFVANAQEYMRKAAAGAVTFSDVAPITIDNRTWRTFRLQCRLPNGIPIIQEVCVYTGPEGTFQIAGWTKDNLFDRNAKKLREVMHSFKFPKAEPR